MATEHQFRENTCFVISVAARMVGVHAQTLRYYEKVSLISPSRTEGRQRLFSMNSNHSSGYAADEARILSKLVLGGHF